MTYFTFAKAEKMAFDVGTSGKRKRSIFFDFRRIERVKQYLLIQQAQNYGFMLWKAQERDPGGYINFSPRSFHYTVDFSHLDSEFTPGSWSSEVCGKFCDLSRCNNISSKIIFIPLNQSLRIFRMENTKVLTLGNVSHYVAWTWTCFLIQAILWKWRCYFVDSFIEPGLRGWSTPIIFLL